MKYEPIFEDAPSPTLPEMEGSRRYQRKMSVYTGVEILAHVLLLIVFPVVMAWVWWTGTNNYPLFMRIMAVIGILALSLMTAIFGSLCIGGRVLIDKDYQMFHYANHPLSNFQWLEIEGLLKQHPEEVGRVSDWIARYDGNLHHRHLWALRRAHTAHHFSLGIVETSDALDGAGNDIEELFYGNDKDEPTLGARDILDERLMALLDGHLIKEAAPVAIGTGSVSRL